MGLVTIIYCLRFETSPFVASCDSQGYGGGIRPRLHTGGNSKFESESESYIMTNGKSASLSWNKAPVWGLRPDFYYYETVAGLLMCQPFIARDEPNRDHNLQQFLYYSVFIRFCGNMY
jgi:hypothetical protein